MSLRISECNTLSTPSWKPIFKIYCFGDFRDNELSIAIWKIGHWRHFLLKLVTKHGILLMLLTIYSMPHCIYFWDCLDSIELAYLREFTCNIKIQSRTEDLCIYSSGFCCFLANMPSRHLLLKFGRKKLWHITIIMDCLLTIHCVFMFYVCIVAIHTCQTFTSLPFILLSATLCTWVHASPKFDRVEK